MQSGDAEYFFLAIHELKIFQTFEEALLTIIFFMKIHQIDDFLNFVM